MFIASILSIKNLLTDFRAQNRGSVTIMAAFLIPVVILSIGAAVDFSLSGTAKSKLDIYAASAVQQGVNTARQNLCAITNPNDNDKSNAIQAGIAVASNLFVQSVNGLNRTTATLNANGYVSGTNLVMAAQYTASYKTFFGLQMNISNLTMLGQATVNINCASNNTSNPYLAANELIHETFTVNNTTGSWDNSSYVSYNGWVVNSGAGLESWTATGPDGIGKIVEMDVYKNTYLTRRVLLSVGNYELRYWYRSRVLYDAYSPGYICGSTDADLAFDALALPSTYYSLDRTNTSQYNSGSFSDGLSHKQSTRVGVYLDAAPTTLAPTSFSPSTNNMIDGCTFSANWIQRSVKINVSQSGYYWLTFQGEGASDGAGALLSTIQLCSGACTGSVPDPFPWSANATLYYDNFSGVNAVAFGGVTGGTLWPGATGGAACSVNNHCYISFSVNGGYEAGSITTWAGSPIGPNGDYMGTINDASSNYTKTYSSPGAWGSLYTSYRPPAWLVWPSNAIYIDRNFLMWGGAAVLTLVTSPVDISLLYSVPGVNSLQSRIAKKLFLTPGYYQIQYGYRAPYSVPSITQDVCGQGTLASIGSYYGVTSLTGTSQTISYWDSTKNSYFTWDVNAMGLYIDNDQSVLTPKVVSSGSRDLAGVSINYNLLGGSSASGWVSPTNINGTTPATAYLPQTNVEHCIFNKSSTTSTRKVNFRIDKSGFYWITFAGESGNVTGGPGPQASVNTATINGITYTSSTSPYGAKITFVQLNSLGGLTMSTSGLSPTPVAIPAPNNALGTTISFNTNGSHFTITQQ